MHHFITRMVCTHKIMSKVYQLLIFLLSLLGTTSYLQVVKPVSCTRSPIFRCLEIERRALLSFKESLTDPSDRLSSWVGEDCCNWIGVGCDNGTGHIIKLDLKNQFLVSEFDFLDQPPLSEIEFEYHYDEVKKFYNKSCLGGKISSALLDLKHLSYLDLSLNNFNGINIPKFLGSLESLRYLNLSFSFFAGVVPPHLGNLSRLQYLDLNSISYSSHIDMVVPFPILEVKSLQWFVGFPSLGYLNLGGVNLEKVSDWLHVVNMLPLLSELHLHGCGLVSLPHSTSSINFTLLSILDLSSNHFNSSIPHWLSNASDLSVINFQDNLLRGAIPVGLGHLTNLHTLDLSSNILTGKIPNSFAKLCNLRTLNLQYNNVSGEITEFVDGLSQCSNSSLEYLNFDGNRFLGGNLPNSLGGLRKLKTISLSYSSVSGSLPNSIGNLSSLQTLDLEGAQMKGTIPESIGKLSMLVSLNLAENSWEGVLTEAHFQNLTRLKSLQLSSVVSTKWALVLNVEHDWIPPFKLIELQLFDMRIGPIFPAWLKTQNELESLDLISVGIHDTIPHGLWKSCPNITSWSLSGNELQGQVPYFQFHPSAYYFDLSFNNLEGPLPIFLSNLSDVYLNNNMFSGPIPENIVELLPKLSELDLSSNLITGRIPHSIGMQKELRLLILRNNSLSGELPPHWKDLQQLSLLDLAENNISGNFPSSMRYLSSLGYYYCTKIVLRGSFLISLETIVA
jgi:Leucine-rich repeat (LRR) protein